MTLTTTCAKLLAASLTMTLVATMVPPARAARDSGRASQARGAGPRPGVTVAVVATEPCDGCPGARSFTLEIRKENQPAKRVVVANQTTKVEQIVVASENRTVVFGEVMTNVQIVTVIDNSAGAPIDYFLCFDPSLSPGGDRIAYGKVFPRHFVEGVSWQYLVYDLRLDPAQNRPAGISLDDHYDVGWPVYPPGARNRPGDNLAVPPEERHQRSSPLVWSEDGNVLRFADRFQDGMDLVTVDLVGGVALPRVRKDPLPVNRIVDPAQCPDAAGRLAYAFQVSGITPEKDSPGTVTLHLSTRAPGCLAQDTLRLFVGR